jgi:hypothetical protein
MSAGSTWVLIWVTAEQGRHRAEGEVRVEADAKRRLSRSG